MNNKGYTDWTFEQLKNLSLKDIKELFIAQKNLFLRHKIQLAKFEIQLNVTERIFLEKEYSQCRFSTDNLGFGYKQLYKKLNAIDRKNEVLGNMIIKLEEKLK